ncbi:MAG TPA: phage tail sheath subtilisin-like domain-containing protein, partial [Bacillota bacterium]|nr:phage tail sheath subtilisin-like domain-containing protein [Bacillota bacterium]
MPNYLSPGVYVEEVSGGVKPISGVGTSTGAFVGIAEKGVIGEAVLITSWSQFVREFGGFIPNGYLAYSVYGFFAEGGASCYVVRTCHYSDYLKPQTKTAKTAAVTLLDDTQAESLRVTAVSEGAWGNKLVIKAEKAGVGDGFKLSVVNQAPGTQEEIVLETFDELTMAGVEAAINSQSALIRVEKDSWSDNGHDITGSGKVPQLTTETEAEFGALKYRLSPLTGGNDGVEALRYSDFIGDSNARNGLHAFDIVDDINIVAIPDLPGDQDLITAALNYCKNRKDCFYIVDPPAGLGVTDVKTFKTFNSSYGALYYPWVEISDPLTGNRKKVPPSGVVAGTYANTDMVRGVHKAPAGVEDGYLDSVVGLETIVTKGEHDLLNPAGINVIRSL